MPTLTTVHSPCTRPFLDCPRRLQPFAHLRLRATLESELGAVRGGPAEHEGVHAGVARRDSHCRVACVRVMTPTLSASRRAARRILARLARRERDRTLRVERFFF